MLSKFRPHSVYDVLAAAAFFLVIAGGTAAAVDGSLPGQNTVGSADIIDAEVTNSDLATDSVGSGKITDRSVKNADLAIGASSSNTIADGGIQGVDVKNLTRTVNLPLGSFQDVGGLQSDAGQAIDFDSSNSAFSPDFALVNSDLVIAYDDDSGQEDDLRIGSNFSVPQDYASGGSFVLRLSKDGHAGFDETFACAVSVNGGATSNFVLGYTTTAANTAYTLTPPATYAAGNSVGVHCLSSGALGDADDTVYFHSVEFRYTADQ
jgi:hypothetical protein